MMNWKYHSEHWFFDEEAKIILSGILGEPGSEKARDRV
jgi:hypothetical protein